ncbi:hypothetical protein C8R43DRAFT_269257 [Mycena crocata]|nr:hypothetical protein C8R43DRAFT_269257 [Mycena crocata]
MPASALYRLLFGVDSQTLFPCEFHEKIIIGRVNKDFLPKLRVPWMEIWSGQARQAVRKSRLVQACFTPPSFTSKSQRRPASSSPLLEHLSNFQTFTTMSTSRTQRAKKPQACDICRARRVLCHPGSNGAPCPRCVEKKIICTTTPGTRGRPRKTPLSNSSKLQEPPEIPAQSIPQVSLPCATISAPYNYDCPDLTPDLVADLFECFDQLPHVKNPIINATSIRTSIRSTLYQLKGLPPQSRVLALCIIAISSLVSFHEAILGPGPRPQSFLDEAFFSSKAEVRVCGMRRSMVCRALQAEAVKAACETEIMLQVSTENAASCLLLDLLEESAVNGASRPWASTFISHLRALAPMWRTSISAPPYGTHWAAFLMVEALVATKSRKPVLFTRDDQLLLCGPESVSAETLLSSLEATSGSPDVDNFSQGHETIHVPHYMSGTPALGDDNRRPSPAEPSLRNRRSSIPIFPLPHPRNPLSPSRPRRHAPPC